MCLSSDKRKRLKSRKTQLCVTEGRTKSRLLYRHLSKHTNSSSRCALDAVGDAGVHFVEVKEKQRNLVYNMTRAPEGFFFLMPNAPICPCSPELCSAAGSHFPVPRGHFRKVTSASAHGQTRNASWNISRNPLDAPHASIC